MTHIVQLYCTVTQTYVRDHLNVTHRNLNCKERLVSLCARARLVAARTVKEGALAACVHACVRRPHTLKSLIPPSRTLVKKCHTSLAMCRGARVHAPRVDRARACRGERGPAQQLGLHGVVRERQRERVCVLWSWMGASLDSQRGNLDISVDIESVIFAGQNHTSIIHQRYVKTLSMLHLTL